MKSIITDEFQQNWDILYPLQVQTPNIIFCLSTQSLEHKTADIVFQKKK